MTYRFYNPAPVFFDQNGLQPLAGGSITFYELGTTTLKDTFSDAAGTVPNANPLPLDADGRTSTDVFLDGDYSVLIEGTDGTSLTRDMTAGAGAGQTIPAPTAGWFLTSPDGVNLAWAAVREVPDPTGQVDKVLSTDGSNLIWISLPSATEPDIVVGAHSLQAGTSADPTKFFLQAGSGSAPASGGKSTSIAVTFPTEFEAPPKVALTPKNANASGVATRPYASSVSATGFTANFSTKTGGTSADNTSSSNINVTIDFDWIAVGTVEVTP